MTKKAQIGVLIEGTIGDSLILIPTLKMLEQHFTESVIHVISFTNTESISAQFVLGATFPSFNFSIIKNSGDQNALQRLGAWLTLTKRVRKLGLSHLIYAFRPENQRASARAKLHKLIIKSLTSADAVGFDIAKWPTSVIKKDQSENLISKLLFEQVAASVGSEKIFTQLDYKINVTQADMNTGVSWLTKHFSKQSKLYYVVCVSGKTESQRWPLSRYLHVIKKLYESHKLEPVFVGSANESTGHARLIDDLGFGYTSAGLTIGQSSAVMKEALFYLGNDTGPMHLAAALGLKCIVVQSSRNLPGTWDPLGKEHIVINSPLDCAGCGLAECRLAEQLCLTNITADQVLSSCNNVLPSKHYSTDTTL